MYYFFIIHSVLYQSVQIVFSGFIILQIFEMFWSLVYFLPSKKVWILVHSGGAKTLLFALLQKHLEFPFWIADE